MFISCKLPILIVMNSFLQVNVVDNNIIDGRLFDDLRDAADAVTSQSEEDARNSR